MVSTAPGGGKLDGDAAVSARLGERRSGRVGPALLPGQAGGAGAEEWPLATFHNETALGGWGRR